MIKQLGSDRALEPSCDNALLGVAQHGKIGPDLI